MLFFERRKSLDKERKLVRIEIHTDRELPTEWEKRKMRKTERARNAGVRREDPQNQKAEVPDTKAADKPAGERQESEDAEKVEMRILRQGQNPRLGMCTNFGEEMERRHLFLVD